MLIYLILCVCLDQRQLILESERRKQSTSLISNSFDGLKDVFLPKGFPNSVSKDYTEYQIWDTLQVIHTLLYYNKYTNFTYIPILNSDVSLVICRIEFK